MLYLPYLLERVSVARRDGGVNAQVGAEDLVVGGARLIRVMDRLGLGLGIEPGLGSGWGL